MFHANPALEFFEPLLFIGLLILTILIARYTYNHKEEELYSTITDEERLNEIAPESRIVEPSIPDVCIDSNYYNQIMDFDIIGTEPLRIGKEITVVKEKKKGEA